MTKPRVSVHKVVFGSEHTISHDGEYNMVCGHTHRLFTGVIPKEIEQLQAYIEEKFPGGASELGQNHDTCRGYVFQIHNVHAKYYERVIEPHIIYFAPSHHCRVRYMYHEHKKTLNIWCRTDTFPNLHVAEKITWETAADCEVDRFLYSGEWKYLEVERDG